MGKLTFEQAKFYFTPSKEHHESETKLAQSAAFVRVGQTLQWATRNIRKAQKLRRFADESAERKFKNYFITSFAPPESIPYPDHLDPFSFQLETVWHCLTRSPAYNADQAGLGKTIESVLCSNAVRGKVMVICPPHLRYNWQKEFLKWSTLKPCVRVIESGNQDETLEHFILGDVIIVPDSLLTNVGIQANMKRAHCTWLFIDEAHRYKEALTKRTEALVGKEDSNGWCITDQAERIVFLSSTPIPNGRPIELYPVLSAVAPESITWRSKLDYGKRFCDAKEVTHYERGQPTTHWEFKGATNLKTLRKELRTKLMVRHLKKDVLEDLPAKTRQIVFLDQPERLEKFSKKLLKDWTIKELLGEGAKVGDVAKYRHEVGLAKINPAFHFIHEILENSDEKLVVFAHHIEVVETLTRMLRDFGSIMIRGGMSSAKKQELVNTFQTHKAARVVVGNIDALSVGATLTAASRTIAVEASWVPGINEQCEDRVHRISQDSKTYHQYLVLRDSLDERMLYQVMGKEESINVVMG